MATLERPSSFDGDCAKCRWPHHPADGPICKNCNQPWASVPPEPPTLSEERYPLITDAECRAFERHAEEGATADPLGEGVEYSLIQPYDLVRFCRTVTELRARIEESDGNA